MKHTIYIVAAALLLNSCGLYNKYQRSESIETENLFRNIAEEGDTASLANVSWQDMFQDVQLQSLIRQGLQNNNDLKNTLLTVQQAEAMLSPAKLAFFPSLALAPQGTVSSFDGGKASFTYQLPVAASWQIDAFGGLLNAKRGAQASLEQARAYKQAVQARLIAGIATCYYSLLMLDKQLSIAQETTYNWQENVETMRAMKDAAMTNEAAVSQSEAAYYQVVLSLLDLSANIREVENQLCLLIGQTPQPIVRGMTLEQQTYPLSVQTGVPLRILARRPDVRASELSLAAAFYGTNQARAAFYPHITLSGSAGWTNSAGGAIFNPAKIIASAVGSLTQPIFQNGVLSAKYKYAKLAQEQASNNFQQTLLNAGAEVSNALYAYEMSMDKQELRSLQVASMLKATDMTKELFKVGNATYLEVISAEQNLLQARLAEASDYFSRLTSVVTLYQALGGGAQ